MRYEWCIAFMYGMYIAHDGRDGYNDNGYVHMDSCVNSRILLDSDFVDTFDSTFYCPLLLPPLACLCRGFDAKRLKTTREETRGERKSRIACPDTSSDPVQDIDPNVKINNTSNDQSQSIYFRSRVLYDIVGFISCSYAI